MFIVLTANSADAATQNWKDATGKFSVEAEFLRIEGDTVFLRRTDGVEIKVPLARLDANSKQQAQRLETARTIPKAPPATIAVTPPASAVSAQIDAPVTLPDKHQADADKAFADGKSYFLWLLTPEPVKGTNIGSSSVDFEVGYLAAPGRPPSPFNDSTILTTQSGAHFTGSSKAKPGQKIGKQKVGSFLFNQRVSGQGTVSVTFESDADFGKRVPISNSLSVSVSFP